MSEGWKRWRKRRTRSYSVSVSTQMAEKVSVTWSRRTRSTRVQVVVDERGRLRGLGPRLDVGPQVEQEAEVGTEFLFAGTGGGGADDEASGGLALFGQEDVAEATALGVGLDLAGDAGVVDGGHEDQEAAGKGDVRGDAGALLGDGLLGDLAEEFLAGLEQLGDGGQVGRLGGAMAATTAFAASAVA